jgi:sugar phosphate isomerase/epimerase
MGACADIGYWMRGGIDPVEGVRKLGSRLITIQMHDLNERTPQGRDVPWGTGAGGTERLILEMHRHKIRPVMFGLEYSDKFEDNRAEVRQCAEFFGELAIRTAGSQR